MLVQSYVYIFKCIILEVFTAFLKGEVVSLCPICCLVSIATPSSGMSRWPLPENSCGLRSWDLSLCAPESVPFYCHVHEVSHGSTVSIAMGYGPDNLGVRV
jgi:hypothetical protein